MSTRNDKLCIAAVCTLVCITSVARAQGEAHDNVPPTFALGPTLGMSLATQDTPAPFGIGLDSGYKLGLAIGISANVALYGVSPGAPGFFIAAQPEVLYASKGVNLDLDGDTIGAYHLSYIEIPILARAGFRVNRSFAPYLLLGPELGILLTAELENSRGEFSDSKEGMKTTDVGLVFGAGATLDIPSLKGALSLEGRYDLGLTDINDTGAGGYVKNRAFFVMLGYQYGAL